MAMKQKTHDQNNSDSTMNYAENVLDRTKEAEQALQGIISAPQVFLLAVEHRFD